MILECAGPSEPATAILVGIGKLSNLMTPAIEIDNLTKDYETGFARKRRTRALDGLSLNVEAGQIFGFLGANGAGKTTTLKLLIRLIFPTAATPPIPRPAITTA